MTAILPRAITLLLGSVRVLKNCRAILTHNLCGTMNGMRHLFKFLPDLRSTMLRVPVNLALRSILSLQPPIDPIAVIHHVVKEVQPFVIGTNAFKAFKGA